MRDEAVKALAKAQLSFEYGLDRAALTQALIALVHCMMDEEESQAAAEQFKALVERRTD